MGKDKLKSKMTHAPLDKKIEVGYLVQKVG